MRNFKLLLCSLLLVAFAFPSIAQQSDKQLNKKLKARIERDCRKEAKSLEKEGWRIMPGKLPLAKQIQQARFAELNTDLDTGEKLVFIGTHQSKGGNYTAAKQIADSRARLELAQSISARVAQVIEDEVINNDYGDGDLEAISDFVSKNKSIIAAQLRGVTPLLEIYREGERRTVEVMVSISVNADSALRDAKKGYVNALKKHSEEQATMLDDILQTL